MAKIVDVRGLSCPQPVILAKKAMTVGQFPIHVLVDTVTSRENIRRAAAKGGFSVRVEQEGDEFTLILSK